MPRKPSAPIVSLVAAALVTVALPVVSEELDDVVTTMPLSAELDARGNLGGVAVDRLGYVYVANFRDALWKVSPEGEVETVTRSLYGSSGIAVGPQGDLFQSNFFGHTITRIDRTGEVTPFATTGLQGPVGIAIDPEGTLFVCNCPGNFIARVSSSGEVEKFAESERFACPNGIVFGPEGDLFVTSFNSHDIVRVSPEGEATVFATVPGGAGNAHITFAKGFFFVTKIIANTLMKVSPEGEVFPVAGTGNPVDVDGAGAEASFARPNGIAVSPTGDRLYVNTIDGEYNGGKPSRLAVRVVELTTLTKVLEAAMDEGGAEALPAAYERYRSDPVRGQENTVAEMVAYGYSHLREGRIAEALSVFRLNAEGYPQVPAAQYQLGEAFRYTGQSDAAVAQYQKTLELDPEHKASKDRLAQLGAS